MTEKEKMLRGMLYDAYDAELVELRRRCQLLCEEFNALRGEDAIQQRAELIRRIVGRCGKNIKLQPTFWCNYGSLITLGENFYANHNCVMLDCAPITFGDGVMIGPNCGFYAAGHPTNPEQRASGLQFSRPITVGDHVWFGGNVVVLPGVTIGSNSVIGAGSVVTHSLPANVIAVGNPCRVLRAVDESVPPTE
ncbi:MAG: sugar O-acetyltransferase [Firmicutes bacterium]|nr:sugar O-acetyltransferase [Bacillota bacterium]